MTPEFESAEKRACYGLLPESASHEGYLAHPVRSYWDDFWALRGLKNAAATAVILGYGTYAKRFAALRDTFAETLYASIRATIAERHLNYILGSVEWADFDPTATANAMALLDESANLPRDAVDAMFDEYSAGFRKRSTGQIDWANYTPHEIRIIRALVRLGKRQSAHELLNFFLSNRRPLSWNQWPEIAWRDPTSPGHLGDLPHTWIGAQCVLSLLSMFAFEREADQSLVIGAGLCSEWVDGEAGVKVRGLPTWYGSLDLTMRREEKARLHVEIGSKLRMPPGTVVLRPPMGRPLRQSNCYYSSSEAMFADRYQALFEQEKVKAGEVSLEGGWRVYSSGGGIAVRLVHECFLGIRKGKAALVIDPVMPKELDGLGAEVELAGKRANILYRVSNLGYGPTALTFNGSPLPFLRGENPYRLRVHIIAKTGPRPVLPKHGNARPGRCVAPPPMGRRAP